MSSDRLQQAKQIDIVSYLNMSGIKPDRENDRRSFYKSPIRGEKTPSFVVDRINNRYTDYGGNNSYGDVIDLVCAIEGCTITQAVDKLLGGEQVKRHVANLDLSSNAGGINILKVEDKLTSKYLTDYLESRCINVDIANKYCKQLTYSFETSPYSTSLGISFANDLGGWEIRSPRFKGGSKPKTVTTLKGRDSSRLCLVEGFFDFLSAATYYPAEALRFDTIVLNSVVFVPFIADYISNYDRINFFLDNDQAGDDALDYLLARDIEIVDQRGVYNGFKDFNEFLTNS